jgi:serine protease Do
MSLYRISTFCAATSLLVLSSYAQEAPSFDSPYPLSKMFTSVGKKNFPGVVFIKVEEVEDPSDSDINQTNPYQNELFPRIRRGSGFFVSADGYIMTSAHIVAGATKIIVSFDRGKELEATLVGTDAATDVAILKVEGHDFFYLPLANSDEIDIGEWVTAVGLPSKLETSLSLGVVSSRGRQNLQITDFEDLLQTDAAINSGNSGGPLLNLNGEVIGMNTSILSQSNEYTGLGFAIPSNMAKNIMPQIIERGNVVLHFLGLYLRAVENGDGALVYKVVPNSPADKAGIQKGDIIVEYEGSAVKTPGFFRNTQSFKKPGFTSDIKIIRGVSCSQ